MELYFVLTILDRAKARVMSGLHREAEVPFELPFQIELLGRGTAQRSQLDFYGLEATEKTALICSTSSTEPESEMVLPLTSTSPESAATSMGLSTVK